MKRMLKKFRETIAVDILSSDDYEILEGTEYVAPPTPPTPGLTQESYDAY